MQNKRPENVSDSEWYAIQKAIQLATEHFQNIALFVNWVDEEGETKFCHILTGNTFALQNHIDKWVDGEFDDDDDDMERAY